MDFFEPQSIVTVCDRQNTTKAHRPFITQPVMSRRVPFFSVCMKQESHSVREVNL